MKPEYEVRELTAYEQRSVLDVSLVLPCYGRVEQTKDLLNSLRRADFACEIILVDDCSPEPLSHVCEDFSDIDIRYIRNEKNSGAAFSRNVGARAARNSLIAFTDNDCVVVENWLTQLHEAITKSPMSTACIGGRVIASGTDIYSAYFDYHKTLDPWFFRGKFYYLTTANAIFRKNIFLLVDGFDESVPGAGGEDPGICFKLQNAGYKIGYCDTAIVKHQYEPTLSSFMRTFRRYGRGCAGQFRKHFKPQDFVYNSNFAGLDNEPIQDDV
ncbi:MAG: glycosyltransferase [Cyanobacteria bacterium HKST-UBA01]|nr:glycosyltransferase [Cyanobacteria bacterium HKST-UBA01]